MSDTSYDAFARDFAHTRKGKYWEEFDFFLPLLQRGDRVLDLGCGSARIRSFMDESVVYPGNYFGLDNAASMLEIARKDFPLDHFFHHDMRKPLPFGAEQFEWVIAIASFHHLLADEAQKLFFQEAFRVLKPGGHLFLTTWILPTRYWKLNWWRRSYWNIPFGKERHPRYYRRVSLKDLFLLSQQQGFWLKTLCQIPKRNTILLAQKPWHSR